MSDTSVAQADSETEKGAALVVNGQPKLIPTRVVTFDLAVELAFPEAPPAAEVTYTVTYRKAQEPKHEGSLVEGESVTVKKEGTVFNVTRTTKS